MKQLVLFLLAVSFVSAQKLTLFDALDEAFLTSAERKNILAEIAFLDSTEKQVLTPANPELAVGTENLGMAEFEVRISQQIRFGSKRELITANREYEKSVLLAQLAEIEYELTETVLVNYLDVAEIQSIVALYGELEQNLAQEMQQLELQFSQGASSQLQLLEHKALQLELQGKLFAQKREYATAIAQLNSYFATSNYDSVSTVFELYEQFQSDDTPTLSEEHPAFVLQKIRGEQSTLLQAEKSAVKAPDFSIETGYLRDNEVQENRFLLGFSLELPFNRSSKLIEQKAHQNTLLVKNSDVELQRRLSAELTAMHLNKEALELQLSLLREKRIPLQREILENATMQYQRGALSVRDKLNYHRDLLSLQIEERELLNRILGITITIKNFTQTLR